MGKRDEDKKMFGDGIGLLAHFTELEREMEDGMAVAVEGAYSSFSQAFLPSNSISLASLVMVISRLRALLELQYQPE
jgi:hypothetical protein